MTIRANDCANFRADLYGAKAARWKALWPELRVLPAAPDTAQPLPAVPAKQQ
jgi:hypothetical protein